MCVIFFLKNVFNIERENCREREWVSYLQNLCDLGSLKFRNIMQFYDNLLRQLVVVQLQCIFKWFQLKCDLIN